MEYTRMSTKDMLQYCDEALAWDQFGPVDIFFFESVKRILLGQCSAVEAPQPEEQDELKDIETPVPAEELISYDDQAALLTEAIASETFFDSSETYTITEEA
ncbi:MAG: hypothetical protein K6F80_07070 [Oscillospiraceae bacterium]|nr:hypothetical protein [Oscillospiraceae bacterium]